MFRNQLTALFTHDRIITTLAKAKELRPVAERMVTIARTGTLSARRRVATMVQDKQIARRLFEEIAPRFAERPGGYTRIMRLGRRHGDNAELAIIEFVDYELADHVDSGEGEAKGSSFLDRAKGVLGGGAAAGAATDSTEPDAEAEAAADGEPVSTESAPDESAGEQPTEEASSADEAAEPDAAVDESPATDDADAPEDDKKDA